ncbi:methyltransferase domain-containing protein, partial [bacterium]|nr:methyltransferase domain-containing protein [bacterium]
DMGPGQGVGALMLAARETGWVTGVDLFPTVLESAKGNEVRNRGLLRGSVEWVLGDVRWLPFGAEVFDLVVLNPPYFRRGEGRVSSNPIRAAARHESFGTLGDWVREGAKALRFGGRLSCVLPLARVEEARGLFAESGLEEVCGEGNEGRAWVVLQAVRSSRSKSTA